MLRYVTLCYVMLLLLLLLLLLLFMNNLWGISCSARLVTKYLELY
jgi:hypothetical protein